MQCSITTNVLAVAGTVTGAAIGMALFFCIVIPSTALLQTWLRQVWHEHSTSHASHGSFPAGTAAAAAGHLPQRGTADDGSQATGTSVPSAGAAGHGQAGTTSADVATSAAAEQQQSYDDMVLELSTGAMWWAHA